MTTLIARILAIFNTEKKEQYTFYITETRIGLAGTENDYYDSNVKYPGHVTK